MPVNYVLYSGSYVSVVKVMDSDVSVVCIEHWHCQKFMNLHQNDDDDDDKNSGAFVGTTKSSTNMLLIANDDSYNLYLL